MKLFKKNALFATFASSRVFTTLGASIYNLVFISYAASYSEAKLTVSLANLVLLIPMFFTIFAGDQADKTEKKGPYLIYTGFIQAGLFCLLAYLTSYKDLLAFGALCLINIISDVLADYRGSLQMPIFQKHIPEEDRMEAYSILQVIALLANLCGQGLGIFLLTISNNHYQLVALVNAGLFLLSSLVLYLKKDHLTHDAIIGEQEKTSPAGLKGLIQQAQLVFESSNKSSFFLILSSILLLNGLGAGVASIYSIQFIQTTFWSLPYASLALVEGALIWAALIGSLTSWDYFSKLPLKSLILYAASALTLFAISNLTHMSPLISLLSLAMVAYLGSKVNPKIDSMLLNNLPAQVLGRVSSFITLLFTAAIPISTVTFTALASFSLTLTWTLYFLLTLLVLGIAYFNHKLIDQK